MNGRLVNYKLKHRNDCYNAQDVHVLLKETEDLNRASFSRHENKQGEFEITVNGN